jgi:translocation protein SEC62
MLRKFLDNEMFRRVVKVYKEEKVSSDQTSSNNAGDTSQSNTPRTARQRKSKSTATVESTTPKDDDTKEKDKSKKKKFKFELHEEQTMIDSPNEFYVWIYSPTTVKQYIMGALLVIGCIGVCLFPLWPAEVRTGVYYLSMVLASLLGLLLSLAVVKYIIFAGVWLITMGKIKFWLLPNLTEDVGFVESFIPFYTLDVTTKKKTDKNDSKKENVDNEDEEEEEGKSTNKKEDLNEEKKTTNESNVVGQTESEHEDEDKEKSTSRSSSIDDVEDGTKPQKSSDEDFEVLSKEELDTK